MNWFLSQYPPVHHKSQTHTHTKWTVRVSDRPYVHVFDWEETVEKPQPLEQHDDAQCQLRGSLSCSALSNNVSCPYIRKYHTRPKSVPLRPKTERSKHI